MTSLLYSRRETLFDDVHTAVQRAGLDDFTIHVEDWRTFLTLPSKAAYQDYVDHGYLIPLLGHDALVTFNGVLSPVVIEYPTEPKGANR